MVKTKQFSGKATYVLPTVKSAALRAGEGLLAGSYGNPGQAGSSGYVDIDEEDY